MAALEKTSIKPGTVFTEESCGTNALALVREHKRLVAIRGEQHYCKLFKEWWCVAGPLKDPAGRIIGYLDISLHAEKELVSTIALLRSLVESIEDKFSRLSLQQNRDLTFSLPPEIERGLTPREREVCPFLFQRLSNKEIAKKLNITVSTVKDHRRNIYEKAGVKRLPEFLAKFGR